MRIIESEGSGSRWGFDQDTHHQGRADLDYSNNACGVASSFDRLVCALVAGGSRNPSFHDSEDLIRKNGQIGFSGEIRMDLSSHRTSAMERISQSEDCVWDIIPSTRATHRNIRRSSVQYGVREYVACRARKLCWISRFL